MEQEIALGGALLLLGFFVGYRLHRLSTLAKKNSLELEIKEKLVHAREHAQKILDEAHLKREEDEQELKALKDELSKKSTTLEQRTYALDTQTQLVLQKEQELKNKEYTINELEEKRLSILESLAGLTEEEAFDALVEQIEKRYEKELTTRMNTLEHYGDELYRSRAQSILATTIQRLASKGVSQLTTASVALPDDESKGKIIGKEGRNIKTFERVAGVELIVDDTPGYIIVSCFDPVRRTIASKALTALLSDGKIHPTKIEEELARAKEEIHETIKKEGLRAVTECGISPLDPKLTTLLGHLSFRTSYGQNVLEHSIETAHLAGMLAEELGADVQIAKTAALLHDIGKAIDHEFEGTHVVLGMKLLKRFGVPEAVISAMKSHHDEFPHETVESYIVQTADMLSGGREGARRDTTELYIKRLQDLERIATAYEGIERAYALQAGRELRIFVNPGIVS